MLSYKIQKIISDFCFDIDTKWRVKPNNISFSISFVVPDIFVCRVDTSKFGDSQIFLDFFGIFLLICKDMVLLDNFFNRCGDLFKDAGWVI